jgi:16S rRNA G966 N2-methylase RsmD/DNA-directed RNA polymerase subunit RPC12/RpoP
MSSHQVQSRLHVFGDYRFDIPNIEALEGPFSNLINHSNKRITPSKVCQFSEKNKRLGDPIYKLFGYPSKVYYMDIANFIEVFTNPGDLVLDPMAGTGATAIAALKTGRKAIISDASPTASFIAKGFVIQIEREPLFDIYDRLMSKVKEPILNLYAIPCRCMSGCTYEGIIENVFVSDWYECPSCSYHFPLLGNYVGKRSVYSCPECGHRINIGSPEDKTYRIDRRKPTILDITCDKCKCGNERHKRKVVEEDFKIMLDHLKEFKRNHEYLWIPSTRIVTDRCYTRKGSWPGFEKGAFVSDLFSPINLWALALLHYHISQINNSSLRHLMLFTFIGSLIRASKRMYTTSVVKTYYQVPPVGKEQNVISVFERKFNDLVKAKTQQNRLVRQVDLEKSVRVYEWDARNLPLPDECVDYVFLDPPYGGQVPYFELNLFYSAWLNKEEPWDIEIIIPMETDDDPYYVNIWAESMTQVFREIYRVLKPGRFFTLMFHSRSDLIWNKLQEIVFTAIGKNKGFDYKFIHSKERGTTFHINQKDSTNPKTAFITYQKPLKEKLKRAVENEKKLDWEELILKRIRPLGKRISLWDAQNEVILYIHEKGIFDVPSSIEIIANLRKNGWEYKSESDELIQRW